MRLRDGLAQDLLEGRAGFSKLVAEAQRALPAIELVLDPQTCNVTAGGETFRMQPAAFAFYWMLVERCQRSRPGVHWSEQGIEKEMLDHYGRIVGPNSGDFERAERAFASGIAKENFDPAKAHIKNALNRQLGRRRAAPYQKKALERIPGTRYHRYGLDLPAAAIRIFGGKLAGSDRQRPFARG